MELFDQIRRLGDVHGIDHIGVAEISRYKSEIESLGGKLAGNYPRAVSIGIVLPKNIVDLLENRDSYENVLQYRHHAYDVINARLDAFSSLISSVIYKSGYQAMPLPAAERIDKTRICASVSHKIPARLAGFGWIGKSCLLINPVHGPRVRWTTVLTDAPLAANEILAESRCGNCSRCAEICPAHAIKNRNFIDHEPREQRLNAEKCEAYFEELKAQNKLEVCGLCLYVCPYGRRKAGEPASSGRQSPV
ncbi:MAG TPA: 4Fe-4S double cluster binding domain-containing protein [Selenomonadales bacterium]|nr:4Fe-4S double cluster binding domain-containing protein [Selenomonadales bacterium]